MAFTTSHGTTILNRLGVTTLPHGKAEDDFWAAMDLLYGRRPGRTNHDSIQKPE